MAANYFYKCNPKAAKAAGVTSFDRPTWEDGTFLLFRNDLVAIDREAFYADEEGFLADIGAVRLTDPQAAEEQRNPCIRLPEARLPKYRWEQPGLTPHDGWDGDGDDGDDTAGNGDTTEAVEGPEA